MSSECILERGNVLQGPVKEKRGRVKKPQDNWFTVNKVGRIDENPERGFRLRPLKGVLSRGLTRL